MGERVGVLGSCAMALLKVEVTVDILPITSSDLPCNACMHRTVTLRSLANQKSKIRNAHTLIDVEARGLHPLLRRVLIPNSEFS